MKLRAFFLGATALLSSVSVSTAQSFNQFIAFGDSTLDDGWFRYQPCPANPTTAALCAASIAANGRIPTTPGGPMNSDLLASYFGLSLRTADFPNGGGTNFAVSGADDNNRNTNGSAPSTVEQVTTYLNGNGGAANPNALYLIQSGGNDVIYANNQFSMGAFTGAQANVYVKQAASALASAVATLQASGARYIVVSNDYTASGPTGDPSAVIGSGGSNARKALYIQTMWGDLVADGVKFIPADTVSMQKAIFTNPGMFGFTSILNTDTAGGTACINPNPGLITDGWSLFCTPALLRSPNAAQTSFFADNAHLSAAGQKIEADYDYSLITAPSEISYLAEVPVKTTISVVNTIFNQIPVSLNQASAYHGWVTGDVSSISMSNSNQGFPSDPGVPLSMTGGFDYRWSPNWLVGAAFSGATTRQTFSLGGDFKQQDFLISAYAAYRSGPYWANAIGSVGWLHDDVNRSVPLGITVQPNLGSTNGTDYSLAGEIGYSFMTQLGTRTVPGMTVKAAPVPYYFTQGPLVGIILQRVHINGYTETDQFASVGGITALSFGDQTRNSAVTELGWQASYDAGKWKPFAKATWNHEWADTDRSVTASLTTPVALALGAPSYSMPAVILGKDWGMGMVGTTLDLGHGITGLASFSSQFAQQSATIYGGQVGVNVALGPVLDMPVKVRY